MNKTKKASLVLIGLGLLIYIIILAMGTNCVLSADICEGLGYVAIWISWPLLLIGIILFIISLFLKPKIK